MGINTEPGEETTKLLNTIAIVGNLEKGIKQYVNQRVIEELEKIPHLETPLGEEIRLSSYYVLKRIKELK